MQNPATGIGRIVNVSWDNPNGRSEGSNLAIFATAVPEVSSWILVGAGLCVAFLLRLRARHLIAEREQNVAGEA